MKINTTRAVVIGILIGIGVGVVLYVIFPDLLAGEVLFNTTQKDTLNLPSNSPKSGSPLAVGSLIPLLTGLFGALLGFLYSSKVKNRLAK